jgi:hypothetical protein
MTKQSEEASVSPEEYNEFIGGIELLQIRLATAELSSSEPPEKAVGLRADVSYAEASYEKVNGGFRASQTYRFTGYVEDDPDSSIELAATFNLQYRAVTPITSKMFSVFRNLNLPVNSWPYFRELVQSSLARAGWPSTVLPAFKRLGRSDKQHEEEEEE